MITDYDYDYDAGIDIYVVVALGGGGSGKHLCRHLRMFYFTHNCFIINYYM